MAEQSRGARKALALAEHPDNLLSTVQVGITLISVLTGVLVGESIGLSIAERLSISIGCATTPSRSASAPPSP